MRLADAPVLDGCVVSLGDPAGCPRPEPAGVAELRVAGGPAAGAVYRLGFEAADIGGAAPADIVLDDPGIPPLALRVIIGRGGGQVAPYDGTDAWLDGQPLDGAAYWQPGKQVAVGSTLLDLIENVASGLRMTPAERSALHVLSRGQDPPMPPSAPGGEGPQIDPGQRELVTRLDAPAAIADETWTLVIRNKTLTAWTGGWFDRVPLRRQNLALFLFTSAAERLLPDIHAYRRAVVAGLRYQYVRHIGSERFGPVIRSLLETGPEARDLWGRHEIVLPRRPLPPASVPDPS